MPLDISVKRTKTKNNLRVEEDAKTNSFPFMPNTDEYEDEALSINSEYISEE